MFDYESLLDKQLITLIPNAETGALEVFYNRHSIAGFSLARYILKEPSIAEDVTQNIFLNLWLKAASYNPQRGTPKAWFMSMAHHRIIDEVRSIKRKTQSTDQVDHEMLEILPSKEPSTEEQTERNLDRKMIMVALKVLPAEQRQVILMAYFEGYSQSEIASALGQPLGTVKTRVRLGIQKLRAALKRIEVE